MELSSLWEFGICLLITQFYLAANKHQHTLIGKYFAEILFKLFKMYYCIITSIFIIIWKYSYVKYSNIYFRATTRAIMADVLSAIREYNVSKKDIEEREGLVIFGDKAWQKTAKTNYVAYGWEIT